MLLPKVLNKLWKFLLNMDPMFIFKIEFSFSFWWFWFLFLCFFSFFYLLLWVHCWFVSCWLWMVVLCDISFVFILFSTTFFLLKDRWIALHIAAFYGFEQIVKILIEQETNVNLQTSVLIFFFYLLLWVHCWFVSCWLWMVVLCDISFVFILFSTTFFLLKNGMTALHSAAFNGFEQIVKILVEHGSNVNLQDEVLIFFFWFLFLFLLFFPTFLFVVVGSLLVCFMLILNGCVVLILILFLFFFLTTFFLLKDGMTALHFAAGEGFEQIVKILIEHGSNVDLQDQVLIFFFISVVFSHFFICCCGFIVGLFHVDCEWLCYVIFDFVFILFLTTFFLLKYGMTALHYAAEKGFEQIVKILIEHRSNINIQTKVFISFFLFPFFVATIDLLDCDGWVGGWVVGMRGWWRGLEWFFFFWNFLFLFFDCVRMGKQWLTLQKIKTLLNWSSNWRFYFLFLSLLFFFLTFSSFSSFLSISFLLIVVGTNDKTSSSINKRRKLKFWQ